MKIEYRGIYHVFGGELSHISLMLIGQALMILGTLYMAIMFGKMLNWLESASSQQELHLFGQAAIGTAAMSGICACAAVRIGFSIIGTLRRIVSQHTFPARPSRKRPKRKAKP